MTDPTPAFDTFVNGLIKEPLAPELLDNAIMALNGWQRDTTEGIDCLSATFSFEDFNVTQSLFFELDADFAKSLCIDRPGYSDDRLDAELLGSLAIIQYSEAHFGNLPSQFPVIR